MKRILICLFIITTLLSSCKKESKVVPIIIPEKVDIPEVVEIIEEDTVPRTSITFVMGKDNSEFNQYYALANNYYRLSPEDKTEIVIDSINSILGVCNYLKNNPPKNERPYGLINMVSHGNEFLDLSALVYPKGPRASVTALQKAISDSVFTPLDTFIIDHKSLIYLHGCGVGNNQELLNNLAVAFGSEQNKVKIKSSKLFEYYAYLTKNKNPKSIRRYFAKTWYAFYHPDSIPASQEFAKRYSMLYPDEQIHWEEGVKKRFQSNPSDLYHFSFVVPVRWEEFYDEESDVPMVNTRKRRNEWLMKNEEFLDLIGKTGVPLEYFQFKYYKPKYTRHEKTFYSLQVRAKSGVLCLIQPLLSENDSLKALFMPFQPGEEDVAFFGFSETEERSDNLRIN